MPMIPWWQFAIRESALSTFCLEAVELLCQILPEEWLIERIQQVGANSRNRLSPSFAVVCRTLTGGIRFAVLSQLMSRCWN